MEIDFNKKKQQVERSDIIKAYRQLFIGNQDGKIVLNDLAEMARILKPAGVMGISPSRDDLIYTEGIRSVFFYITSYLKEEIQKQDTKDYDPFNIEN